MLRPLHQVKKYVCMHIRCHSAWANSINGLQNTHRVKTELMAISNACLDYVTTQCCTMLFSLPHGKEDGDAHSVLPTVIVVAHWITLKLSSSGIIPKRYSVPQPLVTVHDKMYSDNIVLNCQTRKTWHESISGDTQTKLSFMLPETQMNHCEITSVLTWFHDI